MTDLTQTDIMKLLKTASFSLIGVIIVTLMAATVIEKAKGTGYVSSHIYGSASFVTLWGVTAAISIIYLIRRNVHKRPWTFMLHASFVIIICGAGITHWCGEQGTVHLRTGDDAVTGFVRDDGTTAVMPFGIRLDRFAVAYYPGTRSPMDFTSSVTVTDGTSSLTADVSMNDIFTHDGYRFYQSSYDSDMGGSTLAVSHDPWGIGVTYTGYALLLLSIIGFMFERKSDFRNLISRLGQKRRLMALAAAVLLIPGAASAADDIGGKVLPAPVAEEFGKLYVYYGGRICPLETLARDFTAKLCGRETYKGLTAEQVFTGWMFYYNYWRREPIIIVKSSKARQRLGIDGRWACLSDFFTVTNGYKLDDIMGGGCPPADAKQLREADEKFNLASMATTGALVKIFPCRDPADGTLGWYSQADDLPAGMEHAQWVFVRSSLNYVSELVARRDYDKVIEVVRKIGEYQAKEAGTALPSPGKTAAEHIYNRIDAPRALGIALLCVGIIGFMHYCHAMSRQRSVGRAADVTYLIMQCFALALLTVTLGLRWYIAGHIPMSNGFETMQFMAWCALLLSLAARRRFELAVPFGFTTGGMAVMVSMMGESNPQITPLMPVLSSPLLSIHVVMVMVSYALFAFMMLDGVAAIAMALSRRDCDAQIRRLADISRLLAYPAVFSLALGIFIGAVWANISWGRYWGWDPKEVWALITLLIYMTCLHRRSLTAFREPMFFHMFSILAFVSVAITYFGVNFILGGMHSYA